MRAKLDGSEVKAEIQRLEVVSALERFKDPDLMRGERITALYSFQDLWRDTRNLVFMRRCRKKHFAVFDFSKNLEKRRGKPQFYIEEEKSAAGISACPGMGSGSRTSTYPDL